MLDDESTQSQGGEEEETEQGSEESGVEEEREGSGRSDESEEFDKDRALRTIRTLREKEKERDRFERELRETKKQLTKLQKGEQSEKEALQEQIAELQEENSTLKGTVDSFTSSIRRSNFVEKIDVPNPRIAWSVLGDLDVGVEWDDKNRPANLKAIRKALREEFPEQFGQGTADGGKRSNEEQPRNMNDLIRGAAGYGDVA